MKIAIIGSGFAGCLAANYFKNYDVTIIEKSNEITFLNNHFAIMRMKKPDAALILGKKVKEIEIEKNYLFNGKLYKEPTIQMKNSYSLKVTGKLEKRSINQDNDGRRYIFIDNDVKTHAKKIFFNQEININIIKSFDFIVNTISLPCILDCVGMKYEKDLFKMSSVYIAGIDLNVENQNVYQTVYVVDSWVDIYRVSLHDNRIIAEIITDCKSNEERWILQIENVLPFFGIDNCMIKAIKFHKNNSGKIVEIDDSLRKSYIFQLTEKYNIFSLGRSAIWKPGVLADDLVDDLVKIDKMMQISKQRRLYESKLDQLY